MATEAELAQGLINQLLADPKTRNRTLKLIKDKYPDAQIPEIDAAAPIDAKIGEMEGTITALKKQIADDQIDRDLTRKFETIQRDRGYTDEGVVKLKQLMVEKKIPDLDAAADHFDKITHVPDPIQPSGYMGSNYFTPESDDTLSKWLANPDAMTDAEISSVLTEARSGRLN